MAKYIRPRFVVDAIRLDPALAEKLGFPTGAYLVMAQNGAQQVEDATAFEHTFKPALRTPRLPVARKVRGQDRKPRLRPLRPQPSLVRPVVSLVEPPGSPQAVPYPIAGVTQCATGRTTGGAPHGEEEGDGTDTR